MTHTSAHLQSTLMSTLAWTPFLQPAPQVQVWWWLLVLPMALGVAMSYKSIRTHDLARWPRDVAWMTTQIVGAIVGIAVGLYLLVLVVLPLLPAD